MAVKALQTLLGALLLMAIPANASRSSLDASPTTGNAGTELDLRSGLRMLDNVLVIHAVLAVCAWEIFVPISTIALRLDIQSSALLKILGYCQMFSYLTYAAAARLGIWLARQLGKFRLIWSDGHHLIGHS
jgi:hypothetical protein